MGKHKKTQRRKRPGDEAGAAPKRSALPMTLGSALHPPPSTSTNTSSLHAPRQPTTTGAAATTVSAAPVDEVDLSITASTLQRLLCHPPALLAPSLRQLRSLVHLVHEQALLQLSSSSSSSSSSASGTTTLAKLSNPTPTPAPASAAPSSHPSSLAARVTTALKTQRWHEAMALLASMREAGLTPKLGSVQRWVRIADAAQPPSSTGPPLATADSPDTPHSSGSQIIWCVLDAILRTADPQQVSPTPPATPSLGALHYHAPWAPPPAAAPMAAPMPIPSPDPSRYGASFRVVGTERGPERRPPNRHDLAIVASAPGTIVFDRRTGDEVERFDVPHIPGAYMLRNVLSPNECHQLLQASLTAGYHPDEPLTASASVLADACVWLADESILDTIYERVRPHVDPELGGGAVAGINARWRCYRYTAGVVYRPHIDGAWPGSGLDEHGRYKYDYYGDRWSRMTFLIYLNHHDEFEGGCTTFFLPSATEGHLDARPIRPQQGSVMFFPHGDTGGALLHEGSAVTAGAKYIVRTDLLYMLNKPRAGGGASGGAAPADSDSDDQLDVAPA